MIYQAIVISCEPNAHLNNKGAYCDRLQSDNYSDIVDFISNKADRISYQIFKQNELVTHWIHPSR